MQAPSRAGPESVLFPTVQFAIFFPIVLALSWALMSRPRLWKPFILVASYVFYAAASWRFCLLLAGITLGNQLAARLISSDRRGEAAQADRGGSGRARPRRAGRLQVLLVLRPADRDAARRRRARRALPAGHDRAARRDQLLHLPGDLLRGRRQARRRRARRPARRGDLPELLPAPGGGADRARPRVPAPAGLAARSRGAWPWARASA